MLRGHMQQTFPSTVEMHSHPNAGVEHGPDRPAGEGSRMMNLDEPDGREPLRPATRSGRALRRLFISEVSLTKSQIEACVATAIDRRKES